MYIKSKDELKSNILCLYKKHSIKSDFDYT